MIAVVLLAVSEVGPLQDPPQTFDVWIEAGGQTGAFAVFHPKKTESLNVRLTIYNEHKEAVDAPEPKDYLDGFSLQTAEGRWIRQVTAAPEQKGIRRLEYGDFFGRIVDVASVFTGDLEEGIYTLKWRAGAVTSRPLSVIVIPDYRVVFETNRGDFSLQLFPEVAPRTVLNFVSLVRQNFYTEKGRTFHRVLKNRLIQGGCPTGDGTGDTQRIPDEFSPLIHHAPGVVSMARRNEPDSASCQFFICATDQPQFDRRYTAFGRVLEDGMETIAKIARTETHHDKCPKCADGPCKLDESQCEDHHQDRPLSDVVIKKVTLEVNP